MTGTHQSYIHKEVKDRLNSVNALLPCNLESSHHSKNVKMWIYKTLILPVVLYGCESWSTYPKGKTMIEDKILRRLYGPKKEEVTQ